MFQKAVFLSKKKTERKKAKPRAIFLSAAKDLKCLRGLGFCEIVGSELYSSKPKAAWKTCSLTKQGTKFSTHFLKNK